MARLIQITRVIAAFGILFCHHVQSIQETTDTRTQDQNNLQKRLLNQILENSNSQESLIPLLNGKALSLENEFKVLSKKIGSNGDNSIQQLTLKLDDIETILKLLNDKFDTIENDLDIITANLKYPGRKWKNFDGVYYFFSNEAATWDEAKTKCEAAMNSSSLVTIGSKQINDFLIRNGNNDAYWTGGNDKKQEKRWVWVEKGDVVTYTDWRSGEPNNSGGNEDCMVLYTQSSRRNHWNDVKCAAYNRYICQTNNTPTQ